ncbi:MAG: ABC transporter substrate-binding protein [Gemmatimonadetes bacterium]|nr:ABC transporter substrate-binding protein [Gemmatimonadota bacterium]NIR78404.1 ABC transporter substrate-binding protein [Gemmatimonadota bacterium]NIT87016.1 ABC transporter substrate-binding protein [Gemmatimonadota bacterium]NIU30854.1 ABC transporter substrate-binding protein [Gemmatimonadota bacterium]NIU35623.1 ABC transporter substrate-binding protein [Gemmatimonadota bacterium]
MPDRPDHADSDVRGPVLALAVPAILAILAIPSSPSPRAHARVGPCAADSGRIRRVVSLLPSATELLAALGVGDRVVGRSRFDQTPAIAGARSVGGVADPSLETVLVLEPDLVVTWRGVTDPTVSRRLQASGVRVFPAWVESVDDVIGTTRRLARLLCVPERGDSLARSIRSELEAIRASAPSPGPSVLVVLHPRPLLTAGAGSYLDRLIRVAGGRNAFGDEDAPWPVVSLEAVVRRDPDVVVVAGEGDGPPSWMTRDSRWAGLEAFRSGRVLVLPPKLVSRPGPSIVETARRLATFFEEVGDPELREGPR